MLELTRLINALTPDIASVSIVVTSTDLGLIRTEKGETQTKFRRPFLGPHFGVIQSRTNRHQATLKASEWGDTFPYAATPEGS